MLRSAKPQSCQLAGDEAAFPWPRCGHLLHLGCVAHMAVNLAELRCPTPSKQQSSSTLPADYSVFPFRRPMSSTAPFLPSTKPRTRPQPPGTCCPYVAPGCSWHAQVRPLTTPLGRNFPTETWSGRLHSVGPTARGSLSGCASAATQPSTPTTLCCRCCQTAPCVQHVARESSPSTCARAVEVGFVVEEPRRKSSPAHPCVIVTSRHVGDGRDRPAIPLRARHGGRWDLCTGPACTHAARGEC